VGNRGEVDPVQHLKDRSLDISPMKSVRRPDDGKIRRHDRHTDRYRTTVDSENSRYSIHLSSPEMACRQSPDSMTIEAFAKLLERERGRVGGRTKK
jgi:hypothetical protein